MTILAEISRAHEHPDVNMCQETHQKHKIDALQKCVHLYYPWPSVVFLDPGSDMHPPPCLCQQMDTTSRLSEADVEGLVFDAKHGPFESKTINDIPTAQEWYYQVQYSTDDMPEL